MELYETATAHVGLVACLACSWEMERAFSSIQREGSLSVNTHLLLLAQCFYFM